MPILTGGGSMYSTVDDLQRWDSAAVGGSLLSAEGLAALETSHAYRGPQTRYGYGWQFPVLEQEEEGGEIEMRHGGGLPGFTSHILRCATQPTQPLCSAVDAHACCGGWCWCRVKERGAVGPSRVCVACASNTHYGACADLATDLAAVCR